MSKLLWFWLPLVAWMSVIFYLSHQSGFPIEVPPWFFYYDKVVHAIIFGLLCFLFLRAWINGKWTQLNLNAYIISVVFTLGYGISDEVHQMFIPGRQPSIGDVIADTCGAMLVCVILHFIKNRYQTVSDNALA